MEFGVIAALVILDIVFTVAVIVWNMSKKKNNDVKEEADVVSVVEDSTPVDKAEPVEVEVKEEVKPVAKKPEPKPVPKKVEPKPVIIKEEPKVEPIVLEEVEESEESEEDTEKNKIERVPFAKKLISLGDEVQSYYNLIYNFFVSYRKINPRVSVGGASFRFGRELVAKLTIRGKTMKLHLALKVSDFDEKVYFQKDNSDVKAYQEIPFTVKVKSERGTKKALELIAALAVEKGIEKKARFTEVDSLAEIKEKAKA